MKEIILDLMVRKIFNFNIFNIYIKIIVVGTSDADKTEFINRWTRNIFSDTYKPTILSEFGSKVFEENGKIYRIQFWDIAGQERNTNIINSFAKNADGCVVMLDATNCQSRKE